MQTPNVAPKLMSWARMAACVVALAMLAGCSSVPDAMNPVEWYKGTRDAIVGGDEPAESEAAKTPPPGADEPIPNLSTVPERPQTTPSADRAAIASGLISDQQNARKYSNDVIQRQGDVPQPPPPSRPAPAQQEPQSSVPASNMSASAAPAAVAPSTEQVKAAAPPPPPPPPTPVPVTVAPAPAPQSVAASAPTPAPVITATPTPPPAVTAPQSVETQTTEPAQPAEPAQKAEPTQQAQQAETAPVPPGAPRTPPQMREVTAANIAPGTAQPIEPSNIVVPRENPEAPQLEPVTVPPASADQTETVYIGGSGTTEGSGTPSQTSAQTNFRSLPPSGSVSAEVPGTRPLSAYSGGAKNSYQLASIQFADGSSRLSDRDRDVLRGVVDQAKRAGGTLRIIGHASSRTEAKNVARHREANARISAERAEAVARELIRLGMPASSMYVGAVSDADPRYFEFMPTGEAGNRRAEIFIDF